MRYKKNKKIIPLLVICFMILIGIGYAFLFRNPKVNGFSGVKNGKWIIYFDRVQNESGVVSTETKISDNKKQVDFSINLKKPGDYYEFDVDTVNDGTIDAMIDSLEFGEIDNTVEPYLDFDVSYKDGTSIEKCDLLPKNSRKTITVKVKMDEGLTEEELINETKDLTLNFKINYVQKTVCDNKPTLIVDPNGGKYKGTRKLTKIKVEKNSDTVLDAPIKEGYDFLYFTDGNNTELSKDAEGKTTVHVGTTDVKVTANWSEAIPTYVLTIDPDGGIYDGETENTIVNLREAETLTLEEPTKENYIFDSWEEVTTTNSLDGSTVTMPALPVTVKAVWKTEADYVARIERKYYTTIQNAFNAAVDGDVVHLLKSTTENGNNTKNISFDLGGFTVTGTITNSGTLTIDNGQIRNTESSPFVNTGTVNVGTKDGNMIADSIVIFGGANVNGLTQNGTFNFYDGYIEGKLAVTGGYNELEEGYYYIVSHDDTNNCQKAYLSPEIDAIVMKNVGGKPIYFKLLQDAIDISTNDNPNIYAVANFETSTNISVPEGKQLLFDISGFTINSGSPITNNGTFTITNSNTTRGSMSTREPITNNGTLTIKDITMTQATTNGNIIENNGDLNLINSHLTAQNGYALYINNGGEINVDQTTSLSAVEYGIYNNSLEPVTIVGGNLTGVYNNGEELTINNSSISNIGSKSFALFNNNGTLNLNNITVNSSQSGVYIKKGDLNVIGGSYTARSYAIWSNSSSSNINIRNSYVTSSSTSNNTDNALYIQYSTTTNILNTTIEGNKIKGSYIRGSEVTIDDCIISSFTTALGTGGTNVTVKNSTITSTSTNTYSSAIVTEATNSILENLEVTSGGYAVYSETSGTTTIKNSNITSDNSVGIYNSSNGTFKLLSGTIKGKTYGVRNKSTNGTIILGDNSDAIDSTKPVVIGETYGLYIDAGNINFYDGILKGKTDGYYGTITSLADNSTIKLGTETINDELYNTVTLKEQVKFLQVNDGDKYSSLQAAFDAVGTSGTIKVIEDASTTETSSIASNQNITFDLNGHTLETTKTITNNGTLTLVDSSLDESGLFVNNVNNLIENKKMITVNSGTYQSGKNTFNLPSSNTPKIVVNNGTILGTEYSIYSYSRAQNALYIEDGNFNSIYATNTNVIIKGGLITSPKNAGLTVGKNSNIENLVMNHSGTANSANGINIIGGTDVILRNVTVNSTSNFYSAFNKSSASKLTIEGGSYTSNNTAISIGGGSNDKVYIDGAIITSLNDNAIQIGVGGASSNNYGQLYLTGNTIVNGKKSGVIFVSNGTLILGEKGSSVDTSKPSIIGGEYGINGYNTYSLGNIEFYDGIVKGKIESLYNVYPDILEPVHSLKYSEEIIDGVTYQTVYLERQLGDFLQVGSSTFSTLQDAIDSITTDGTITVIGSGDLVEPSEIPSGKNITLDLNANSITTSNTITNNGIFTLKDSSGDNSGTIYIKKNTLVENNNQLTVDSGSYISEVKMYATANIIHQNVASSNTIINGGILYGDNPAANSSLSTTIYTEKGDLTINGGTIRNKLNSPLRLGVGTTIINNVNNTEVYSDKVSSDSITCLRNQDLTINGGTFNGRINISYGADVTINNGTIVSENGTAIDNGGTLAINAGYIKGKTYGISTGSSVLVIGSNDSTVSTSSPIIVGGTYGIGCSSNNKIEFYDGIIKGKTGRFQYTPKTIATGTNLVEDTETDEVGATILTAYLEKQIDFIENVNKSKVYKNFKTAVSEASSGDLLRLIDSSSSFEDVTIDKNLTIDLNNNSLTTSKAIVNTAKLTIKDDSTQKNGMLTTASGVNTINNSGTLIAENVHLNSSSTVGGVYVIYNTGEIELTNASINATSSDGIYNENSADLNSCSVNARTGIYSYALNNNIEMNILDTDIIANYGSAVNSNTSSLYKANVLIDGGTYKADRSNVSSVYFGSQNSNSDVTIQNASFVHDLNINVKSTIDNIIANDEVDFGTYEHTFTNSTARLVRNSGDLTINNLTVNGSYGYDTGVFKNTGNVDATDLNIITTNSQIALNNESGVFNFNSGQITNTSSSYGNYCVYIKDGTFNLKSGTIKNNSTGSNDSYGIYMKDGTLTIGTYFGGGVESTDVSTTNPYIESINTSSRANYNGIGVKVLAGTFNYYDGLIIGSTEAKPEAPTAIEPRYRVFNTTDINGYDNCVLQYVPQ